MVGVLDSRSGGCSSAGPVRHVGDVSGIDPESKSIESLIPDSQCSGLQVLSRTTSDHVFP